MSYERFLRTVPRQARSVARLDAILDATGRVLETASVDQLTITAVATEAGVSTASVYDYVADTRALVACFVIRSLDRNFDNLVSGLTPVASIDDLRPTIRYGLSVFIDLYRNSPGLRSALAAMAADPELERINHDDNQRIADAYIALVAPFVRPELHRELADRALLAVNFARPLVSLTMLVPEDRAEELIQTFLLVFSSIVDE